MLVLRTLAERSLHAVSDDLADPQPGTISRSEGGVLEPHISCDDRLLLVGDGQGDARGDALSDLRSEGGVPSI